MPLSNGCGIGNLSSKLRWGGISDHLDLPADDKCKSEQMRGTCEPPGGVFPLGRGGGVVRLLEKA
ncbi:MAG: hypothetical protein GU347_02025 [Desulfurococcales archaeon]|nr:hypothetical protein [Desulfurococcales archaeon]